jgi:hypothetical protein
VLRGRWQFDPVKKGPVDEQACLPYWFVCSLLELGRKYVALETDRASSPARATAFLHVDHTADEWHLARPRYRTERVVLDATLWLRRSTESRQQFLIRIIGDMANSALRQVVPEAESMDRYVEEVGLPYEAGAHRADPERARESARVILGKPVPDGGSGKEVRDRLLVQLGFLAPRAETTASA